MWRGQKQLKKLNSHSCWSEEMHFTCTEGIKLFDTLLCFSLVKYYHHWLRHTEKKLQVCLCSPSHRGTAADQTTFPSWMMQVTWSDPWKKDYFLKKCAADRKIAFYSRNIGKKGIWSSKIWFFFYLCPNESLITAKSHRAAQLKLVTIPLSVDWNTRVMTFILTKC